LIGLGHPWPTRSKAGGVKPRFTAPAAARPTRRAGFGQPAGRRHERMKEVIAIVKPFLAERVLEALKFAPLEACTVREVKGYGRQKSYLDAYGDSEYSLAFLPKVEIQLWVDDARVDEVVNAITAVARTGRMGDGKIFVLPAVAVDG
jgi:nitrogen regulatory protein PII